MVPLFVSLYRCSINATSVDVPPMSKVMRFGCCIKFEKYWAAASPPAGPERSKLTAFVAARFASIVRPEDCITDSVDGDTSLINASRYRCMIGPT